MSMLTWVSLLQPGSPGQVLFLERAHDAFPGKLSSKPTTGVDGLTTSRKPARPGTEEFLEGNREYSKLRFRAPNNRLATVRTALRRPGCVVRIKMDEMETHGLQSLSCLVLIPAIEGAPRFVAA